MLAPHRPSFISRLLLACFLIIPSYGATVHAELDNRGAIYNKAVNPLRAPTDRIQALEELLKEDGFEASEELFLRLLSNPREHVLVKRYIVQLASHQATKDSALSLTEIMRNDQFDAKSRQLALKEFWQNGDYGVEDLRRIIQARHEDLSLRGYAITLLRQPKNQPTSECRTLLLKLAKNPFNDVTVRRQALSALANNLDHLTVKQLFEKTAKDTTASAELREPALLMLHHALPEIASEISWKLLADSEEPATLRVFALSLMPDDKLAEHIQDLYQLEAKTMEEVLRKELRFRLETFED